MARRLILVVDTVALLATVPITYHHQENRPIIDSEDHDSDIRPIIIWDTVPIIHISQSILVTVP